MNTDLMLALDSDQEKLVGSHPEGDADTCARERNNSCLPLLAAVRGLQFENRQKYQKKKRKKTCSTCGRCCAKLLKQSRS